jgi:hypothetical protein
MKRINTSKVIMVLLLILSLTAFGGISYAEKGAYPTKPIEWIIPYGAGGSTDLGMRIMGGGGNVSDPWRTNHTDKQTGSRRHDRGRLYCKTAC